jgi:hypothetical protein
MWHFWTNELMGFTVQYTTMHAYNRIIRLRMVGAAGKPGLERADIVCMMLRCINRVVIIPTSLVTHSSQSRSHCS